MSDSFRQSSLRKALFQLHLWGGLALSVYAALIGITGSILMFRDELVDDQVPTPAVTSTAAPASIESIRAAFERAYPEGRLWTLSAPSSPTAPWSGFVLRPVGGVMAYADPEGRIIGELTAENTWFHVAQEFHSHLLLPRGRLLNGLSALALVMLSLFGLVLWWPARGEWRDAFRIVRRSSWKGWNYDLHRVGGVLMLALVVGLGVTGAYFAFGSVFRWAVSSTLPTRSDAPAKPVVGSGPTLPLDDLVGSALGAMPGTTFATAFFGERDEAVTIVVAHEPAPRGFPDRTSEVSVSPFTAEVVRLLDYRDQRLGDHVLAWMGPAHAGRFGGWPVTLLWTLAGLAYAGLSVTGVLMWWNRVVVPWRRGR